MRMLIACAFAALVSFAAQAAADNEAPVITHTPVTSAPQGEAVAVLARITDASKFFPQVFYRHEAGGPYQKPIDMKPVKGEQHMFGANIPVKGALIEYYIEAYDELGNGPGRAGDPDAPIKVHVGAEGQKISAAPPAAAPAPATPPPAATHPSPPASSSNDGFSGMGTKHAPSGATSRSRAAASTEPTRIWTWAVGGTGLGLLVGGLFAGLAAKSAGDAYNARLKDPQNNPVTLQSQYDAAQGMGSKATILTITGAVLLAGGVALYFFEPQIFGGGSGSGVSVAAAPVEGGGAVAMAGHF